MAEPRNAFICGHPVVHSRSPLIHGYWLEEHGIEGTYRAVDVTPADFPQFIRHVRENGFVGGNVTLPHKEAALAALDELDEAAERIGAANTVWLDGERLVGTNTDWQGFTANMDEMAPGWDDARTAIMLGAGGAARGVLYALAARGIRNILIVNRSLNRAEALSSGYSGARAAGWEDLPALLGNAELLINTTSLGMPGHEIPEIDVSAMPDDAIVSDIVYVPLETSLLRRARLQGLRCVDGLGMLLHQAVPGFEKWFGVRPTVTPELRQRVLDDLELRT